MRWGLNVPTRRLLLGNLGPTRTIANYSDSSHPSIPHLPATLGDTPKTYAEEGALEPAFVHTATFSSSRVCLGFRCLICTLLTKSLDHTVPTAMHVGSDAFFFGGALHQEAKLFALPLWAELTVSFENHSLTSFQRSRTTLTLSPKNLNKPLR